MDIGYTSGRAGRGVLFLPGSDSGSEVDMSARTKGEIRTRRWGIEPTDVLELHPCSDARFLFIDSMIWYPVFMPER